MSHGHLVRVPVDSITKLVEIVNKQSLPLMTKVMSVSIFVYELAQSVSSLVVPQHRHLLLSSSRKGESEKSQLFMCKFSCINVFKYEHFPLTANVQMFSHLPML